MKNRELRVGNLIASLPKYNKETSSIGKVLEIGNSERDFEQIYVEGEESFDWFFKDNYCGIPLNRYWLLKFGFEEMSDYFRMYLPKFGEITYNQQQIAFVNDHNWFFFPNKTIYVHQLQNLYFALTGEELTLKYETL